MPKNTTIRSISAFLFFVGVALVIASFIIPPTANSWSETINLHKALTNLMLCIVGSSLSISGVILYSRYLYMESNFHSSNELASPEAEKLPPAPADARPPWLRS